MIIQKTTLPNPNRTLNNILNDGPFDMWKYSMCLMYRGSIAHGTHLSKQNPSSVDDIDVFGIYIPPQSYIVGLDVCEHYEVKRDEWDVLCYDLRKFIRLLIKMNPNVMNALWTPQQFYLRQTDAWKRLCDNKSIFTSKQIFKSFCGYSQAQLHKMEAIEHNGYMGEKRKALVEKYGFDCKNGSHLIRLLRQGIEFLNTGELNVERTDANELKAIKQGEWSLEKVKKEATILFSNIETAYQESTLPEKPNIEAINILLQELLIEALEKYKQ